MLLTGDFGQPGHQFLIAGCGQREVMRCDRRAGYVGQAVDRVHGNQHRHAQTGAFRIFLYGVHGGGGSLHAAQFADQQHADAFLVAPLLQIGRDFTVRTGQEGGMLHLRNLLTHGHLSDQIIRAGVGILAPVLVNIQFSVGIEVDKLISVHLDDGLDMGGERRPLIAFPLGEGCARHHASRQRHRRRKGQAAPEQFVSQQGSSLLSHPLP